MSVSRVTLPSARRCVCAPADAGGLGLLGTAGVGAPRGRALAGGFCPSLWAGSCPWFCSLGSAGTSPRDALWERCRAGTGGGWSRRVLPVPASPREFWGAGQLGVAPPPLCSGILGLAWAGQEMGPGLTGGRRWSLKSQPWAVAPTAQGSAGSLGQHRDPSSRGLPICRGNWGTGSQQRSKSPRGGGSEGSCQVPPLPHLQDPGSQGREKFICIDFY